MTAPVPGPEPVPVPEPAVECHELAVGYAGRPPVLAELSLTVPAGSTLALLGASGSGKTTLLHAVAGLLTPQAGRISLAGRTASTPRSCLPPERRSIGMVFQHYALWPHLSAVDTVAYPLRRAGVPAARARQEALHLLEQVQIGALADRLPAELSGGQQQRVGLARALARRPALYLFDEPTAHLDAHLRGVLADEITRQRAGRPAAALYATHDAAEALAVADLVAVIDDARLVQLGIPQDVYERPADRIVARLTGPGSLLRARATAGPAGRLWVRLAGLDRDVDVAGAGPPAAGDCALLVRPEWAALGGELPGCLAAVRFRGPHTDYLVETAAGPLTVREPGPPRLPAGARITWSLHRARPLPG